MLVKKISRSSLLLFVAVLALAGTTGCDLEKKQDTSQDAGTDAGAPETAIGWKMQIKNFFNASEPVLFGYQYIKDSSDAFYLKNNFSIVIEKIKKGAPVSESLRDQLESSRDDYELSRPVIAEQIRRIEHLFALVSVVSANSAVEAFGMSEDRGLQDALSNFTSVLSGKEGVLTKSSTPNVDQELSPLVSSKLLVYADRYVVGALRLLANDYSQKESVLKTVWLNPTTAKDAGMSVSSREAIDVWHDLEEVYRQIFDHVNFAIQYERVSNKQIDAKSLDERLAQMKLLRETESKLLSELKLIIDVQSTTAADVLSTVQ